MNINQSSLINFTFSSTGPLDWNTEDVNKVDWHVFAFTVGVVFLLRMTFLLFQRSLVPVKTYFARKERQKDSLDKPAGPLYDNDT